MRERGGGEMVRGRGKGHWRERRREDRKTGGRDGS